MKLEGEHFGKGILCHCGNKKLCAVRCLIGNAYSFLLSSKFLMKFL